VTKHQDTPHCVTCRYWQRDSLVHLNGGTTRNFNANDGWGSCQFNENVRRNDRRYLPTHETASCNYHAPRPDEGRQ
jgi:hypothetical protein